jgi:allophanate hydrolase subunit 1
VQRVLENGYESDSISQAYYSYIDIRHLSLDELISGWNELTVNLNKKAVKVSELEEEVKALETELEKSNDKIEELEERVTIEQEESMKALDKSKE